MVKPDESERHMTKPNPTPSRGANPYAVRSVMARRDAAMDLLARLDAETVAEMVMRGERVARPDGFPAGLGSEGVSGGSVPRPTEAAALAGMERSVRDDVGQAIAECFAQLSEALGVLRAMDAKRVYVLAVARDMRGRISSLASCECCGRDIACTSVDRPIAGFCAACYKAWQRYLGASAQPDRVAFVRDRRASLEATG